ncbi:lysophospholipid acyltransferase 5 [Copidosoma floridanum]|uniref:lysophospholipid acyltransferase 5 n=1 Tax=Copidosoma floridanum TaxID=29053 RepID=UPI0006C99497|nr:lysophospholipid acyltransferase 5 [Copidosoma floridanum]
MAVQHFGPLTKLSDILGTSPDALGLFISILLGFPVALLHRKYFFGKNPQYQHYFFTACGFVIGFLNYDWNILHSLAALLGTYLVLKLYGGTSKSVIICFIYNLGYLLVGYYTTATDDYDIKWTLPQCVLTLRLIGLAFDVFDGRQPENKKPMALHQCPSLLEVAAYTYFPGSFLVGPQFSMKRYLDYVNGKLVETEADSEGRKIAPNSLLPGIKRASLGFLYIFMYQVGRYYVSDQYLLSSEFDNLGFLKRCFLVGLWARCNLYKYISCWLIAEGVCIAFGLTYNGKDNNGKDKWDGCANVELITFENATEFNHYILSFNVNTNHWAAEYIYKRCKFLGSKLYSQLATLIFLAIWHGFHSGYYACFFMEFIIMYFEKDLKPVLLKHSKLQYLIKESFLFRILVWSVLKVYTFVFMGYSMISFILLSYSRYMKVYSSFYFMGHIIFLSYPIFAPFIKKALMPQRSEREHTD